MRKSKKTSKLRVTGLCAGNSPGTGEFPAQMASYAENVSIWWRHHDPHHHNHANGVSHLLDDHRLRLWKLRMMRTLRRRWGDLGSVFARNCLSIYGSVSMVLYLHVWKQRTYSNESSTLQSGGILCVGKWNTALHWSYWAVFWFTAHIILQIP